MWEPMTVGNLRALQLHLPSSFMSIETFPMDRTCEHVHVLSRTWTWFWHILMSIVHVYLHLILWMPNKFPLLVFVKHKRWLKVLKQVKSRLNQCGIWVCAWNMNCFDFTLNIIYKQWIKVIYQKLTTHKQQSMCGKYTHTELMICPCQTDITGTTLVLTPIDLSCSITFA